MASEHTDADSAAGRRTLANLFTRFTADRDRLLNEVRQCRDEVTALAARVEEVASAPAHVPPPSPPPAPPVVAAESGAVSEVAERAAHAVKLANQALESAAVLANEFEARLRALDARLDGALAHAGAAASTSAERARAREQADAALAHAGALRADLDALRERVQRQEQALAALEGQGTQLAEATRHERDVGNRLDALEAGITTVSEALREQDRLAATVRGEQEELARRHRDDLARLSETLREALLARDDQRARESAAAGAATAERLELTEARLGHLEGRLGALIAAQRPEAEAPRRPSPALDVYATAARAAVGRILLVLLSTLRALVPAPPAGPASKPTR